MWGHKHRQTFHNISKSDKKGKRIQATTFTRTYKTSIYFRQCTHDSYDKWAFIELKAQDLAVFELLSYQNYRFLIKHQKIFIKQEHSQNNTALHLP
jgi:hypothetical protein